MNDLTIQQPVISKWRVIVYWVVTAIVVLETAVGGEWDLTHNSHVDTVISHLGYPLFILSIIGFWKVLAVITLLVPGFGRLKEWAYAGLFFVYSGAALSQFAVGDFQQSAGPVIFAILALLSWTLRPPSRRTYLEVKTGRGVVNKKWPTSKKIVCWTALVLLEFSLLSSGAMELVHFSANVDGIVHQLGYPLYFLTIQGFWKLLACIALALPGFRVLKEWAYAGVFFNMTGAIASNMFSHLEIGHVLAPLFMTGICMISWALRPAWRKM